MVGGMFGSVLFLFVHGWCLFTLIRFNIHLFPLFFEVEYCGIPGTSASKSSKKRTQNQEAEESSKLMDQKASLTIPLLTSRHFGWIFPMDFLPIKICLGPNRQSGIEAGVGGVVCHLLA